MSERQITGRHVLLLFVSAFSLIIAVNLTLAWNAVATFPGVEVKNSYVASQKFDAEKNLQLALGWDVGAEVEGESLILSIKGPDGRPVRGVDITATFGRATHVHEDMSPAFVFDGAAYVADVGALNPGNWNLRLAAVAPDGTPFRQRIPLRVRFEN